MDLESVAEADVQETDDQEEPNPGVEPISKEYKSGSGSVMSCSRETYVVREELVDQEKILAGSPDQQVRKTNPGRFLDVRVENIFPYTDLLTQARL